MVGEAVTHHEGTAHEDISEGLMVGSFPSEVGFEEVPEVEGVDMGDEETEISEGSHLLGEVDQQEPLGSRHRGRDRVELMIRATAFLALLLLVSLEHSLLSHSTHDSAHDGRFQVAHPEEKTELVSLDTVLVDAVLLGDEGLVLEMLEGGADANIFVPTVFFCIFL